ncbi:hypothetical protein GCM10029964_031240 [Kibdelosporangium lantanae]
MAPPSPKSVLARSSVAFHGWKYWCGPPGTSATFTWSAAFFELLAWVPVAAPRVLHAVRTTNARAAAALARFGADFIGHPRIL